MTRRLRRADRHMGQNASLDEVVTGSAHVGNRYPLESPRTIGVT
jgi:hypothetical protein